MKTRLWNRLSIRLIISISVIIITILSIPNSGKITFKIDEDADYVVIRIINEDTEISEKNMPHIFLPFYSTKEAPKGTGLGLAVIYGIINHHYGNIKVDSTFPNGTKFKIKLPKIKNT